LALSPDHWCPRDAKPFAPAVAQRPRPRAARARLGSGEQARSCVRVQWLVPHAQAVAGCLASYRLGMSDQPVGEELPPLNRRAPLRVSRMLNLTRSPCATACSSGLALFNWDTAVRTGQRGSRPRCFDEPHLRRSGVLSEGSVGGAPPWELGSSWVQYMDDVRGRRSFVSFATGSKCWRQACFRRRLQL
jgi:hypothetical protein